MDGSVYTQPSILFLYALLLKGGELGQPADLGLEHLVNHGMDLREGADRRGQRVEHDGMMDGFSVARQ